MHRDPRMFVDADDALNHAATQLKAADKRVREALSAVRKAQALWKGVEVETIETHSPQGGHSGTSEDPADPGTH